MSTIIIFLKRIIFATTRMKFRLFYGFRSNIIFGPRLKCFNLSLDTSRESTLSIGRQVTLINCRINIHGNGIFTIGDLCVLKNLDIDIAHDSAMNLEQGVIFISDPAKKDTINIHQGHLNVNRFANLSCSISIRFQGRLTIGMHTGIGFGSQLECDQEIEIGKYCLISNNVDIFDTNSHSIDFAQRRERIELGYPSGCSEVVRPATAAIKIGDDVWIGKKSMILKGVSVGDRCIVGMGSVVTPGNYPADSIIVNERARTISRAK